jgi:tetratricopeptide (TPR) repeat protein
VLETLLDSHLIQPAGGPGRYRFHDLLRAYAAERAAAEEPPAAGDAALGRLLTWYLGSAVTADQTMAPGTRPVPLPEQDQPPEAQLPEAQLPEFGDSESAVQWLKTELPNLHAAIRLAAAREDHQTTWKLAAALCTFHMRQSLWTDWITAETTGLASARKTADLFGQAWLLNGMAVAHWQTSRTGEAMTMLRESLQIRRAIGDRVGIVATLANLGFLLHRLGRLEEVISTLTEALAINDQLDQPDIVLAEILIGLGETHQALGHYEQAAAVLSQALDVGRRYCNGEWEGAALLNLANLASRTGEHAEAATRYGRAVAVFHRAGDRYQETTALIEYGHALTRSGRPDLAPRRWRQARTIMEQTGDPRITAISALLGRPALTPARHPAAG